MKKKNIDKKVALSIGGLSVLCLGLLFGAWYLSHEPEESFTPAAQEVETLAETWDDKLELSVPEASIKEEALYTGEVSDNTQTVISEDENGSNVDLSGSVTKEEAQETKPTEKPEPIGDTTNRGEVPSYPEEVPVTAPEVQAPADNSERVPIPDKSMIRYLVGLIPVILLMMWLTVMETSTSRSALWENNKTTKTW